MTKRYPVVQIQCINDDKSFDYDRYYVVDITFISSGIKITTSESNEHKEVIFYPTHQVKEFWYTEEEY